MVFNYNRILKIILIIWLVQQLSKRTAWQTAMAMKNTAMPPTRRSITDTFLKQNSLRSSAESLEKLSKNEINQNVVPTGTSRCITNINNTSSNEFNVNNTDTQMTLNLKDATARNIDTTKPTAMIAAVSNESTKNSVFVSSGSQKRTKININTKTYKTGQLPNHTLIESQEKNSHSKRGYIAALALNKQSAVSRGAKDKNATFTEVLQQNQTTGDNDAKKTTSLNHRKAIQTVVNNLIRSNYLTNFTSLNVINEKKETDAGKSDNEKLKGINTELIPRSLTDLNKKLNVERQKTKANYEKIAIVNRIVEASLKASNGSKTVIKSKKNKKQEKEVQETFNTTNFIEKENEKLLGTYYQQESEEDQEEIKRKSQEQQKKIKKEKLSLKPIVTTSKKPSSMIHEQDKNSSEMPLKVLYSDNKRPCKDSNLTASKADIKIFKQTETFLTKHEATNVKSKNTNKSLALEAENLIGERLAKGTAKSSLKLEFGNIQSRKTNNFNRKNLIERSQRLSIESLKENKALSINQTKGAATFKTKSSRKTKVSHKNYVTNSKKLSHYPLLDTTEANNALTKRKAKDSFDTLKSKDLTKNGSTYPIPIQKKRNLKETEEQTFSTEMQINYKNINKQDASEIKLKNESFIIPYTNRDSRRDLWQRQKRRNIKSTQPDSLTNQTVVNHKLTTLLKNYTQINQNYSFPLKPMQTTDATKSSDKQSIKDSPENIQNITINESVEMETAVVGNLKYFEDEQKQTQFNRNETTVTDNNLMAINDVMNNKHPDSERREGAGVDNGNSEQQHVDNKIKKKSKYNDAKIQQNIKTTKTTASLSTAATFTVSATDKTKQDLLELLTTLPATANTSTSKATAIPIDLLTPTKQILTDNMANISSSNTLMSSTIANSSLNIIDFVNSTLNPFIHEINTPTLPATYTTTTDLMQLAVIATASAPAFSILPLPTSSTFSRLLHANTINASATSTFSPAATTTATTTTTTSIYSTFSTISSSTQATPSWPVKHASVVEGNVILGGLMMVHSREDSITCGPIMPQGGIQALEAMLYTLDQVNKLQLLPNITLGAHILDDCDKDTYGLEMAVDFIKASQQCRLNVFCIQMCISGNSLLTIHHDYLFTVVDKTEPSKIGYRITDKQTGLFIKKIRAEQTDEYGL